MIKPIVKDIFFLSQKSEVATKQDLPVGQDLMDTLRANQNHCAGMAANMIGVLSEGHGFLHYRFYSIISTSSEILQFKPFNP